MSGYCREALPEVRNTIPDEPEWWVLPPLRYIRDGIPDFRKGLPTTLGYLGGAPNHSRTSGRASLPHTDIRGGSRPLPDIRNCFPTTPGYLGRPPNHTRISGGTPGYLEGCPDHTRTSWGPPDHSRTYARVSRPLPDIWEGLLTTPGHLEGPPTTQVYPGGSPELSGGTPDNFRTSGRAS